MISWIWIIPAVVIGVLIGLFCSALMNVSSKTDDWADGYRAGRNDA